VPTGRRGGLGFFENNNFGNIQYQAKATHLIANHQIRYGVLYEDIEYNNIRDYSGPTFTLSNGTVTQTGATVTILPETTGLGQIYRATRANFDNYTRTTTQKYTSFFVQDSWKIGGRLTVNPGVRYEQQKLVGTDDEFTWDGNWAPRIGATFDMLGNGRSKIYASWGRFYAKIPNDLAARALSSDAGISRADYYDAALQNAIPEGVRTVTQTPGGTPSAVTRHLIVAGASPAEIDPDSKSTFQEEVVAGVEYELGGGLAVGARYIHRKMPRILEDIGQAAFALYDCGNPTTGVGPDPTAGAGCQQFPQYNLGSVEYFITNPRNGFPSTTAGVGSFEDPIHDYDAVEITADKRFGNNWALQSSYRWSRLKGNFEGFFRNDNGQSDPAISSLFDFPTNDPTYTTVGASEFGYRGDVRYLGALGAGPLPNDRTHQMKVYGNYSFNMGINLGLGLNVGSGRPLTPFAANPNYASAGEIPEAPRGTGFETVDGFKKRSPMQSSLDGHVDYAFKLGGSRRLVLGMDVLNLTNHLGVLDYDNFTETTFGVINPDFGQPVTSSVPQIQTPRQIRFAMRFEF
jgi:TonB dependent receptor-like, beta-barrel